MNKTALVTGSSKGIGRAIVLELAKSGYDVCINCSNSLAEAEQVKEICVNSGVQAVVIQANIATTEGRKKLFEEYFKAYDHIDVLVNNAGITRMIPFFETTEKLFDDVLNLDLKGSYFCSQYAAKNMVETGTRGVIVNITSIHQETQFPFASVYGPCKAALMKLTKHLALELARYGIRVVAVAPGCTLNDTSKRNSARTKLHATRIPLRRWAECEEIAHSVAFLVSDKADYVTGICLPVEGGVLTSPIMDFDINKEGCDVT